MTSIAPVAVADERPPVVLEWSAPSDCPTAAQVVARVKALLARPELARETLAARATIAADGEGFRLELVTKHGEREHSRTLRATACDELANAAALVLALLIDPTLRSTDGARSNASPPEERVAEREARPRPRGQPIERPHQPHLRLVAGPVVDFGSLPALAPGLELGAGVELGRLAATLSGVWFLLPADPEPGVVTVATESRAAP